MKRDKKLINTPFFSNGLTWFVNSQSNGFGANQNYVRLYSYNGDGRDVTIPDEIEIIGGAAFYKQDGNSINLSFNSETGEFELTKGKLPLKSVKFSVGVIQIEDSAFEDCSALEKIDFYKKNIILGFDCFKGCSPKIITIHGNDLTIEDIEFLKSLKDCGMSLNNLENISDELKLLIETGNL